MNKLDYEPAPKRPEDGGAIKTFATVAIAVVIGVGAVSVLVICAVIGWLLSTALS